MNQKDKLFDRDDPIMNDFAFDVDVAFVFDDMVRRSVPFYDHIIQMIIQIIKKFALKGKMVYDLGCSTGTTLIEISKILGFDDYQYVGIDNSIEMIQRAVNKAKMYHDLNKICFHEGEIESYPVTDASVVIMNYTLQFIRPLKREQIVRKIFHALSEKGVFILSEKVVFPNSLINRDFIEFYYDFKKSMGYSELEIAKKREALENVLIPFSIEENKELLLKSGFQHVEPFFQWFNFVSFLALKN